MARPEGAPAPRDNPADVTRQRLMVGGTIALVVLTVVLIMRSKANAAAAAAAAPSAIDPVTGLPYALEYAGLMGGGASGGYGSPLGSGGTLGSVAPPPGAGGSPNGPITSGPFAGVPNTGGGAPAPGAPSGAVSGSSGPAPHYQPAAFQAPASGSAVSSAYGAAVHG